MHKLVATWLLVFLFLGGWNQAKADESALPAEPCTEQVKVVQSAIEKANHCTKTEDCAVEFFGCPFGCETLLHRSEVPSVAAQVEQYNAMCDVCMYKCPATASESGVACVENQCVRAPEN